MPFQGLNEAHFTEILEVSAFDFRQVDAKFLIQDTDEIVPGAIFLLSGKVEMETKSFNGRISIVQQFEAPKTMPLHYLFGADIYSHNSLKALTKCSLALLSKKDMLRAMQVNNFVLINTLNHLCTLGQKEHKAFDFLGKSNSTERMASWLLSVTDREATDIWIEADMQTWCELLRVNESEFWRSAATLEGRYALEFDVNKRMRVIDRYEIRRFLSGVK